MRSFLYDAASGRIKGFIPALISLLLWPLSLIYGLAASFLAFFYKARALRLPCKVISVGNITLGGTGKSVLAGYIAGFLAGNKHKVAILSRGYKSNPSSIGDEPLMFQKQLKGIPVIVDTDRIRAAFRAVKEYGIDTALLDDGFQQWRIKKDLDILLIDAVQGFGNARLIPAGILREPLSSIRRAGLVIFTKTDLAGDYSRLKAFVSNINPSALLLESVHAPEGFYRLGEEGKLITPEEFKAEKVGLFCGIAAPDSFYALVKKLGVGIGPAFYFPDHHDYSPQDIEDIRRKSLEEGVKRLITTEKDAARLDPEDWGASGPEVFVLRITLRITKGEERFRDRLLKLYSL